MKTVLKWVAITFGGLIALLFVLAMGFGFATTTRFAPATVVQTGEELPERQHEALRKAKILERKETVKYYYLEGLFDPTYSGSILTDKRILGFWTEEIEGKEDVIKVYDIPTSKIFAIETTDAGGVLEDAIYQVSPSDSNLDTLNLFLSVEEGRHLEMVSAIEQQIEKNQAAFEKEKTDAKAEAVPATVD